MTQLSELRDLAERALAAADPAVFREVGRARTRRPAMSGRPRVVIHPDEVAEPVDGLTPGEGTVTLYWAPRSSSLLPQLEGAMATGDFSAVAETYGDVARRHAERSVGDARSVVRSLLSAPSFFDLRYGGRTLAMNLWLDDSAELGSMTFAFAGGAVHAHRFEVVEYPRDEKPEARSCPWDTLVVVRRPRLSDLERRLVEAIPESRAEMQIGESGTVMATPATLVVIAIFVAINTIVTTCCSPFRDRLAEVSLPPEALRDLGSARSVAELVSLRTEVLESYGVL
jgi:hypothetical protein